MENKENNMHLYKPNNVIKVYYVIKMTQVKS